jgi:hypothetical protein
MNKQEIINKLTQAYDLIHEVEVHNAQCNPECDLGKLKKDTITEVVSFYSAVKHCMKEEEIPLEDTSNWKWHNPEGTDAILKAGKDEFEATSKQDEGWDGNWIGEPTEDREYLNVQTAPEFTEFKKKLNNKKRNFFKKAITSSADMQTTNKYNQKE